MLDPRIEAYIRQHRRTYTREALTKQLEDAGHDRAAIDATWAALDAPDPDQPAGEGFWGRFWLILIGVNVAVFLGVGFLTGMLGGLAEGGGLILIVFAIVLGLGALIAFAIVAAVGPTKLGRTTATVLAVAIPALFALLIGGACYSIFAGAGPPPATGTLELSIEPPREVEASGSATCYGTQQQGGFSIFGEITGSDGELVIVSIDSFGAEPGVIVEPAPAPPEGVPTTNVNLSFGTPTEKGFPQDFHTGPGTSIEVDLVDGGQRGMLTFAGLQPSFIEETGGDEGTERLAGTIAWDCTGS